MPELVAARVVLEGFRVVRLILERLAQGELELQAVAFGQVRARQLLRASRLRPRR